MDFFVKNSRCLNVVISIFYRWKEKVSGPLEFFKERKKLVAETIQRIGVIVWDTNWSSLGRAPETFEVTPKTNQNTLKAADTDYWLKMMISLLD